MLRARISSLEEKHVNSTYERYFPTDQLTTPPVSGQPLRNSNCHCANSHFLHCNHSCHSNYPHQYEKSSDRSLSEEFSKLKIFLKDELQLFITNLQKASTFDVSPPSSSLKHGYSTSSQMQETTIQPLKAHLNTQQPVIDDDGNSELHVSFASVESLIPDVSVQPALNS